MRLQARIARRLGRTSKTTGGADPTSSRDHVVDTFHTYRLTQVVEIKQAILQVHTGERTREEVLEKWRLQLVNAMRYGQVLYVRCANCNPTSLADRLTGDSTFPLSVFDHATLSTLAEFTPPLGSESERRGETRARK